MQRYNNIPHHVPLGACFSAWHYGRTMLGSQWERNAPAFAMGCEGRRIRLLRMSIPGHLVACTTFTT